MALQLFLQYYTLFNLTDFINLLYFPYLDKALGFKRTLSCFQQQPLMLLLSTHTSFSVLSELFLSKGKHLFSASSVVFMLPVTFSFLLTNWHELLLHFHMPLEAEHGCSRLFGFCFSCKDPGNTYIISAAPE